MAATPPLPEPTPDAPTLRVPARVDLLAEDGAPAPPQVPTRTVGRYAVLDEIGRGGMGIVYRAFDQDLRRHVAMKVLRADPGTGAGAGAAADLLARFVEEAQATAQLQHPGIVPVHDVGQDPEGRLYFVMKLVRGRTLERIVALSREGAELTAREFTRYRLMQVFVDVARAVAYAHARGVVHRDLKPQNVMIGRYGEVQVMDWGLAKVLGAKPRAGPAEDLSQSDVKTDALRAETEHGALVGTPAYMAPEQAARDPRGVGPPADVYALGATLFHVLTGRAPYVGSASADVVEQVRRRGPPRPRDLDPSVPRELEAVCLRAMARRPGDRYPTAQALADDAQSWLEGQPVAAYPEGPFGRALKWGKRHRAVAATAAGALVALLVGLAVAVFVVDRQRRAAERAEAGEREARLLAEAREAEASRTLARLFVEKGDRALAAHEMLEAEVLFAKALTHADERQTRERLVEARARGARLLWTWTPAPGTHEARLSALAWAPDGRRLVVGNRDGTLRSIDASTGRELGATRAGGGPVHDLAFAPEGRRIAVANGDGAVALFDLEPLALAVALGRHERGATGVAFRPDGRQVASIGFDEAVRLWDSHTGAAAGEFPPGSGLRGLRFIAWSPDGTRLAFSGATGPVRFVEPERGRDAQAIEVTSVLAHFGIAFAPDGDRLAVSSGDGAVYLFGTRDGEQVAVLRGHEAAALTVVYEPAGTWLASAGGRSVRLWHGRPPVPFLVLRTTRPHPVAVAPAPDGRRFAVGHGIGTVQAYEFAAAEVGTLRAGTAAIDELASSPDGARLVTGSAESVRILDLAEGREVLSVRTSRPGSGLAFTPDGAHLLASGRTAVPIVLDAATGRAIRGLAETGERVHAVAFSPDGRHIATAGDDGVARVIEPGTGGLVRELRGHGSAVLDVEFSRDGRRIATASRDGTARLWEAATGRELNVLQHRRGRPESVVDVAFSPDGRRVASAGALAVLVWDAETGARTVELEAGGKDSVAFSPDGRRIAATGSRGEVVVWDAAAGGQPLYTLRGHERRAICVAFTRDGRLAVGGEAGVVRLWDLEAVERTLARPPAALLAESEARTGLRADDPTGPAPRR